MTVLKRTCEAIYEALKNSLRGSDDAPIVVWVGDAHHRGTDIYWSDRLDCWIFVDLENRQMQTADKIAVYASEEDGDETGLNQSPILACDFMVDREGIWVVGLDLADDPQPVSPLIELIGVVEGRCD